MPQCECIATEITCLLLLAGSTRLAIGRPQSIPNPRHKLTTSTLPAFPLSRTKRSGAAPR